jgi:DNA-binding LacI/PurR family transcriptional regulator
LGKKWLGTKDGIDQFFDKGVFPASVVCMNDYVAQGVYETAAMRHLKIGEDIKIVGFGDYPLARFLNPKLTTMRSAMSRMGYDAAGLLDQTIQKKFEKPVQIYLPVEMVVRESA